MDRLLDLVYHVVSNIPPLIDADVKSVKYTGLVS